MIPSTIAVYGPDTRKSDVSNNDIKNPTSYYGCNKVLLENLGNYYRINHNVDFRSLRITGVISPEKYAYNGSTDYASEMFDVVKSSNVYKCCLNSDTRISYVYIDDIIDGIEKLLNAKRENLTETVYNTNNVHFSPIEYYNEVIKYYKNLKIEYNPDKRDSIAKSWPYHYNDEIARKDFGWNPKYNSLEKIVKIMYEETKL